MPMGTDKKNNNNDNKSLLSLVKGPGAPTKAYS